MMVRSGCAQLLQLAPHGRLIKRDRKFVVQPLDQIDQPPANNAVDRRDWAAFNNRGKRLALGIIKQRLSAQRLAIEQMI